MAPSLATKKQSRPGRTERRASAVYKTNKKEIMKARERERERERERSVLRSEHETITKRTHRNHDARSRERERERICALPKNAPFPEGNAAARTKRIIPQSRGPHKNKKTTTRERERKRYRNNLIVPLNCSDSNLSMPASRTSTPRPIC